MSIRRTSARLSTATSSEEQILDTSEAKAKHKRPLSLSSTRADVEGNPRTSKRTKAHSKAPEPKTTPKKSQYFEAASDSSESPFDEDLDAESGYEESASGHPSAVESASAEDHFSESSFDEHPKRKASKPRRTASTGKSSRLIATTLANGKELWREGVKAGLGPGKQVFIEKPKPRGDGGIKYRDDRIHPNTLAFLADLKENNDREWFKSK